MTDRTALELRWAARRRVVRLFAIIALLFGPLMTAAWQVHGGSRFGHRYAEVRTPAADDEANRGAAGSRVTHYLQQRVPYLDRLLPDGAGGTRYFVDLGGPAGMADPIGAAIAVAVTAVDGGWPEAVELHERAHLFFFAHPEVVSALLAKLPAPHPDEYAATDPGEHFGEMAASAWQIVVAPRDFCTNGTSIEHLREAETRVPGTAAFLTYFLERLPSSVTIASSDAERDVVDALGAEARRLGGPYRAEWIALERAIDARRRPDGTLTPIGPRTVRTHLELLRAELRSGSLFDRLASVALLPSLALSSAAGL